ncbi:MAG: ATP-dependent DNA helicase RecG [Chloroflexi bacterium]|nr:ATP-dependent DNA helicase RecG [Chloroflexota bacterium]
MNGPVPPEIGALRRILALEQERGYGDRVVIGGLDRYLRRLSQSGVLPPGLPLPPSPGYAFADPPLRQKWVESVLSQLSDGGGQAPLHTGREPSAPTLLTLDSPVLALPGFGPGLAYKLSRLGVSTIKDALYFFPHRHVDYSCRVPVAELRVNEEQTVVVTVWQAQEKLLGSRRSTEAQVADETGSLRVVWFNQPYLARRLLPNTRLALSGRVGLFQSRPVMDNPEYELLGRNGGSALHNGAAPGAGIEETLHTGRLVPIYPLTEGLSSRQLRRLMKQVVDAWAPRLPEFLPAEVRRRNHLPVLGEAVRQAHFPDNEEADGAARRRLAFDELFLLQLGVLARRSRWQSDSGAPPLSITPPVLGALLASLPFSLTGAQRRALDQVLADAAQPRPMARLLQGEVGSGKTVVAALALLMAALSGYQSAFMVPTELLAEQHFRSVSALFQGLKLPRSVRAPSVGLLTGSLKASQKEAVRDSLGQGKLDIVIGTQALIQDVVEIPRLGLVVVDEQHRFGVRQRASLRGKAGESAHLLVMTATPIPRSLALTLYGDLDLSVIDELPPGRQEIATRALEPAHRDEAYDFIREQVAQGRQAFIICPLVEESDAVQAKAAVAEYQRLAREVFPELRLGLVHGQMPLRDRDDVMRQFRDGRLAALVATPVIEVGIDIPNATVMLIEGADRFGLAQLHQFRGRVGRGPHASCCLLLAEDPSPEASQRLRLVEANRNGFLLAEEDLRLRGPGDFFGTRQSGLPELRLARLSDTALLELARAEAQRLFEVDPELSLPDHAALAQAVARAWRGAPGQTAVAEA